MSQKLLTITDAYERVGKQMFGDTFGGTIASRSALSQADQIRLNEAVMMFIHQNPIMFRDDEVKAAANAVKRPTFGASLDTSFDWKTFGNEILNNARDINPLDPQNIKTVSYSLLAGAVILGAIYLYVNKGKSIKQLMK